MRYYSHFVWLILPLLVIGACGKDTHDSGGDSPSHESQPEVIQVTGISLDKTDLTLVKGETFTLNATVAPDNASSKTVTWASGNSEIASVSDGVVTALRSGKTTIMASAQTKTAICLVTIKDSSNEEFKDGGDGQWE